MPLLPVKQVFQNAVLQGPCRVACLWSWMALLGTWQRLQQMPRPGVSAAAAAEEEGSHLGTHWSSRLVRVTNNSRAPLLQQAQG